MLRLSLCRICEKEKLVCWVSDVLECKSVCVRECIYVCIYGCGVYVLRFVGLYVCLHSIGHVCILLVRALAHCYTVMPLRVWIWANRLRFDCSRPSKRERLTNWILCIYISVQYWHCVGIRLVYWHSKEIYQRWESIKQEIVHYLSFNLYSIRIYRFSLWI